MFERILTSVGLLLFNAALLVFMGMQVLHNTWLGWDYVDVARFVGGLLTLYVTLPWLVFQLRPGLSSTHARLARACVACLVVGMVGAALTGCAHLVLLCVAAFG